MDPKNLLKFEHQESQASWFIEKIIGTYLSSKDKTSFSWKDKILFYKELVYMMKWWVSLMEAMTTIRVTSDNYAVKMIAGMISEYLNKWKDLSYAISRLPKYFDEWDAAIIKTWEASWNLPEVLQSLAEEYAYLREIKQKYIWAMIYPCFLILFSIIAVIYLFGFVLPWIFDTLLGSVNELPETTRILKTFSDIIVQYRDKIIIFSILFVALIIVYASTESWNKNLYSQVIKAPIIGNMTKSYYLIKRARYMKLMLWSWMTYVDTFRLLRDILKIPLYQSMIEQVLADISLWKTLYEPLSEHRDIIPANVSVLIKVWEETANLENAMWNIISIHQEELDNSIKNFSKAIEPFILVFVWWIVLLIASWVFSLIFAVMDSAGL